MVQKKVICPNCKIEMNHERHKKHGRIYSCPKCGFYHSRKGNGVDKSLIRSE